MGWKRKAKELLRPREVLYLFTITILSLLLPLSFLLLATLSGAQYYLQTLTSLQFSPQPFPRLFHIALNINPCILYVLVSIVSVATLIQGLMGKIKITLFSDSPSPSPSPSRSSRLSTAWALLCAFQVCVGLGIEGSIAAGLYDEDYESSFGVERSLVSRMIFLLGLHETTHVWCRMVVRPVVDDTVFGASRRERWIERVGLAAGLGTLWWWRLREEVETLVVVAQVKNEQLMDVGLGDFVGWWLYYLVVTIGMVRIVKGLIWMFMISLCTRRPITEQVEESQNDDKV
ncbi:uncharacterized protein LOC109808736 [Cajanus cajan]|uniref:Transmembrane protein n=1 Tax=Cajanus cajan TaxID=3821 RepID=A0A151SJS2_CAJCA|nr:uncharacterized protein LOC109808736 [Cajanus cajan]KYP55086.1 hypothetical protein KK1_001291 [Cajanus cajan]